MLLSFLGANDPSIMTLVYTLIVIIFAFSLHEFAHAYVADRLGDPTPRMYGRLTLNPAVHLDPWGFLMILFVGFGWAKPVPVNTTQLKGGQRGAGWVALAGPLTNLALAIIATTLYRFVFLESENQINELLYFAIVINLILMIFNFIPLPPLDGYKMALAFLPTRYAYQLAEFTRRNQFVVFIVFVLLLISGIMRAVYNQFIDWYLKLWF